MEVNSEHDKNSLFIDLLFKTPQKSSKKCYWEPFRTPFFSFFLCTRQGPDGKLPWKSKE